MDATTTIVTPKINEVFELTIQDYIDPLQMMSEFGYKRNHWKYHGKGVAEPHTRIFKLVSVGYCAHLDEVICKISAEGKIPEGEWIEAFRVKYPYHDKNGPIGIADNAWESPGRRGFPHISHRVFPCVRSRQIPFACVVDGVWIPAFVWTRLGYQDNWRWIVEIKN